MGSVLILVPLLALIFLIVNLHRWRVAVTENDLPQRTYYFRLALGCALLLAPVALNLLQFMVFRFLRVSFLGNWGSMALLYVSSFGFAIGLWLLGTAWFFRWSARSKRTLRPTKTRPTDSEGVWPPPPNSPSGDGPN